MGSAQNESKTHCKYYFLRCLIINYYAAGFRHQLHVKPKLKILKTFNFRISARKQDENLNQAT